MDITNIVLALFSLLSVIISGYLVPYLKKKIGNEKFNEITKWCDVAVRAAEQLYKTGAIGKDERKQYVVDFLNNHGLFLDYDQVEALIESNILFFPKTDAPVEDLDITVTKPDQ